MLHRTCKQSDDINAVEARVISHPTGTHQWPSQHGDIISSRTTVVARSARSQPSHLLPPFPSSFLPGVPSSHRPRVPLQSGGKQLSALRGPTAKRWPLQCQQGGCEPRGGARTAIRGRERGRGRGRATHWVRGLPPDPLAAGATVARDGEHKVGNRARRRSGLTVAVAAAVAGGGEGNVWLGTG